MCAHYYLDTEQLITYTQVNVCTKLPTHCAVNNLHAGLCVQNNVVVWQDFWAPETTRIINGVWMTWRQVTTVASLIESTFSLRERSA